MVGDVLTSAFDSAGQRCSALRVLCLQEDIADRVLAMLKGAMAELRVGNTERLNVDIGPVITAEAKDNIERHIAKMRALGRKVERLALPDETAAGTFVAPTMIELELMADLDREVFGPVLHVIRYRRRDLDRLIDAINATGYGLTFGLHTRMMKPSRMSRNAFKPATSTSTATSSARWSAYNRSAGAASPAPARKPAGRCISAGWSRMHPRCCATRCLIRC